MANKPQQLQAQLKKAESLLQQNKLDKAELLLSNVCKKTPRLLPAWLMLASIYGRKRQYQGVIDCAKKVISLDPKNAVAYSMVGSACCALQNYEEAIKQLNKALKLDKNNAGILNNLGSALYASGKPEQAITILQRVLQLAPGHPQAHFVLGNCFLALGKWHVAVASYKQVLRTMPENEEVNMNLAVSLCNMGELRQAKKYFQQAQVNSQQPAIVLYELARVCQLLGELEQAKDFIEQSLQHKPENYDAVAEQVTILYKLGQFDKAHEKVVALVNANGTTPVSIPPAIVLAYGQLCHRYNECAAVISLAEDLIEKKNISQASLIDMHYLSGKLHDRLGHYDKAYSHYVKANQILPGEFNGASHNKAIDGIVVAYNSSSIATLARSSCMDERPVFIVGMPRSGTSLVEQILTSHAAVSGIGESNEINEIANALGNNKVAYDYVENLSTINQEKLTELAQGYLAVATKQAGNTIRITDKMPANVFNLGLISQLFPKARIIHCQRDPRDICLSIFFQHFSRGLAFSNKLNDIILYYQSYNKIISHWKAVLDIPIIDVNYAELVTNVESVTRKMLTHLDLPWDESCLHFYEADRAMATASFDQVRQGLYTSSLNRWKNYKEYIAPLLEVFGEQEL